MATSKACAARHLLAGRVASVRAVDRLPAGDEIDLGRVLEDVEQGLSVHVFANREGEEA